MNLDDRKKHVKHQLIDLEISFREWCRLNEVSHSVARDIVTGRLDGSKSEKNIHIKTLLKKQFGKNIFD